ncbi:two-component sensor histidine kinase [Desulfobacter hydrogenophilus]|uniref:histidine kinase n=1 Tax=Desulfobacter hydrogenophilus TaxID=2291 RepID=A0A328FIS4_9BACT|nr:sensor histidine kinase [Desulfobacter hydrogenophilus]NDY72766.1 two-component sensor histidine kinase [Desulfobacter hydrogenophilus]QBH12996.1 sensor histidine kinase [Desulfobacter hydrogenophilus]RAM04036.1 two-component sensor histidine kinase [Desulfobacter hydrogenophilus]
MHKPIADRKEFYQVLTRNIRIRILLVSIIPMMLTLGILCWRFHLAYSEKISAHIGELVLKHTQNIDTFLKEKLGNIRYLSRQLSVTEPEMAQQFLTSQLSELKDEYGDVFTDLGLVDSEGIQVAYEGPFRLVNADYSEATWFLKAIDSPYYISDVFAGLRGHPHFILAVKLSAQGRTYILRSTINFTTFNSLVENVQIGRTGTAFIVNAQGQLQTHPRPRSGTIEIVPSFIADPTIFKDKQSLILKHENDQGNTYLYALALFKTVDWRMVFRQDTGDALRNMWKAEVLTLIIFLLGCTAIVSVSFTLSKNLVKRIAMTDQKNEAMNQQVVESGKLATIGELAAGIAHEINNPVAIMVEEAGWMSDLLEEETGMTPDNRSEFHRAIEQIATQGRRCKDITHKLLSFARKSDATEADIDINDTIREIVELTAQMARYNNVTISTRLAPDLPFIRFSPSELQQVILNLTNNAIDAMGKDGGTVEIITDINTQDNNMIEIKVDDNGPGIPAQYLDRVFDPFFTTKAVGKGTGLGLSICYGIIQKMGGTIEVESHMGQGTCFLIRLPLNARKTANPSTSNNTSNNL